MRILDLVHVHPSATRGTPSFFYLPAGVLGLLNELRAEGYSVAAINEPLEMAIDSSITLERLLADYRAACYSIDIHWHEHLYGGVEVASAIKRLYPDSLVIAGGMTASLFGSELLSFCPAIDVVICGYGEHQLLDIVASVRSGGFKRRRVLITNKGPDGDIDRQDFVTDDFLLHADEYTQCSIHNWYRDRDVNTFWLKNGQGCRGNCSFCGGVRGVQERIFGNRRVVRRSVQLVGRDMIKLSRRGVARIALTHDISESRSSYWQGLHRLIRDSGESIGLYFEANRLPSRAYIESFSRTFDLRRSVIVLTPLCESETLRLRNGRPFGNEQLWECLADLKRCGVEHVLYFCSGIPFEDRAEQQRQTEFIGEIQKATGCEFVFRTSLTLDPGSPMHRRPKSYGILRTLNSFDDYLRRCRLRSLGKSYDKFGYTLMPTDS